MTDLFEVPESPSPRLAWLKKHRLTTKQVLAGWECRNAGHTYIAYGYTYDEAILAYCEKYNLKHWTLE